MNSSKVANGMDDAGFRMEDGLVDVSLVEVSLVIASSDAADASRKRGWSIEAAFR